MNFHLLVWTVFRSRMKNSILCRFSATLLKGRVSPEQLFSRHIKRLAHGIPEDKVCFSILCRLISY